MKLLLFTFVKHISFTFVNKTLALNNSHLNNLYKIHAVSAISGRYITTNHLDSFINSCNLNLDVKSIGYSVNKQPINCIRLGNGSKRVLIWSQMHGNESTTTKAVLDLIHIVSKEPIFNDLTLKIIPILNPDGAKAYARENANGVDLNRDAQDVSQPESEALKALYNTFKPHYCFNLHDQRTMYSVASTNIPATLSFLAPATNKDKTITAARKIAMAIISSMSKALQADIPNGIGRYDDTFNINCVGDTFQSLNTPTILVEAGHFKNDYNREFTRKFVYKALLVALNTIDKDAVNLTTVEDYQAIPENGKCFFDVLIKNVKLNLTTNKSVDIGINYQEVLQGNNIYFKPIVAEIGDLHGYFGHKTIQALHQAFVKNLTKGLQLDYISLNNEEIALKPVIS